MLARMASKENPLLKSAIDSVRETFVADRTILSFREYFDTVAADPKRHLRSSAQYLKDMFDHFGTQELLLPIGKVHRLTLLDVPFADGEGRVAGQEAVAESIYRIIADFAREGRVNKLILMHGPNGSAKSSMVRAMMTGMEHYARRPEGALYSFNWIFPTDNITQGGIGFGASPKRAAAGDSYAYVPAENIDARLPCEMHDHPLFLLPHRQRVDLLKALASPEGDFTVSDYLRVGDLCYKCRAIYDALLASYDGDATKVLNHIQIERFFPSRRYRRGVATVEPQMSVDAHVQQVTADRSFAALPKALQHLSLYNPTGPLVDANRGLLEFSDLLKRPVEAFKYLLGTVETATVSMDSFVLHLDMVFIGSTNESYLSAFKQHADFASFKGRMELLKVPYLLRYSDERAIYLAQSTPRTVGRHVAPHAIDVIALWAVLTRMRRCDHTLYPKEISEVIHSLTPLEKLRLYDTGEAPKRLTTREAMELRHVIPDLYKESLSYPNYEGRFGASAREIRTALLNAAHHEGHKCLSPLAVFEEIQAVLGAKSVYEFLNQEVVAGYHDHEAFLEQSEALYLDWVDEEVRESMGLVKEGQYTDHFRRYISHITHWVRREKMQDPTTGQLHDPDERFMGEVERVLVSKGEKHEDFRRAVISKIGARSLENPGQPPAYDVIFRDYIERLRLDFYTRRRDELRKINENFLKYTSDQRASLTAKDAEQVAGMLKVLETRYGYCQDCARDTVAYLLKKRYG